MPGNKRVYVKSVEKRVADSLLQVTTTFNKNEAKDFESFKNAENEIVKFFNPFNREFVAEKLVADKKIIADKIPLMS